jgi:hypothetical protein
MKVVFSFMAALILTEFLKTASGTYYSHATGLSLVFILITALFLFFMIFDTVVWLVFSDKTAVPQEGQDGSESVLDSIIWLGCRFCEFFVAIWLYDFINIVRDLAKAGDGAHYMDLLVRFNLDSALISFGWALWFVLYRFTFAHKAKHVEEQTELRRQGLLHFLAMVFFLIVYLTISTGTLTDPWFAVLMTGILVVANILRIFYTQPTYYKAHAGLYGA